MITSTVTSRRFVSPPPIEQITNTNSEQTVATVTPQRNLGDVLCDLNFEQLDLNSSSTTTSVQKDVNANNDSNSQTNIPVSVPDPQMVVGEPKLHHNEQDAKLTSPQRILSSSEFDSQNKTTPCSVLTSPDAREMETANLLLGLGNPKESIKTLQIINAEIDNEEVVPIGAPLEDITNMAWNTEHDDAGDIHDDSEKTVDYTETRTGIAVQSDKASDKTVDYTKNTESTERITNTDNSLEVSSLKGSIRYRHYGIRRQSPKSTCNINMRCFYCDETEIFHSKRELNEHHRTTHTTVQCPDCCRVFPTLDALQRHRYVHNTTHQFKCHICNKICGFKSDLDMHMTVHIKEKMWPCPHDDCNREFKRKSDLTAHEVTHTGEDFICEFAGCHYKNKDPRLVKRHQRVHTKKKPSSALNAENFLSSTSK